jgi:hypothetical protein
MSSSVDTMSLLPRPIARLALLETVAVCVIARLAGACRAGVVLQVAAWSHGSLEPLATALGWWLAAVVMAWLVFSTIVSIAAHVWPRRAHLRRVESLGAALITRYVEAAFALALGAGMVAASGGAVAAAPPTGSAITRSTAHTTSSSGPVTVEVQPDGTLVVVPPESAATTTTRPVTTASTPPATSARASRPSVVPAPSTGTTTPSTVTATNTNVVVVPGDNLWRIASAHLTAPRGGPVADDEVVSYWRTVVAANRATLRSGDPNLIFPGELVTLPPLPPAE